MLLRGNKKTGRKIYHFSIPAIETCPGRSQLCSKACYATHRHYKNQHVIAAYQANLILCKSELFVPLMVREIQERSRRAPIVVRLHCSGDLYDVEYANKWLRIMTVTPETRYYFYTRSWRVPEIRKVLIEIAKLPNVVSWWSCDAETGIPAKLPSKIRVAYLSLTANDIPAKPVGLIFRKQELRGEIRKKAANVLVCPQENGITTTTCLQCKVCLVQPEERNRIPLALL